MSGRPAALYDKVVQVTRMYLGPAADRFVNRQIHTHLHKDPQDLVEEDLDMLIDWTRAAVSLLTEDSKIVSEYTEQLTKLATMKRKK